MQCSNLAVYYTNRYINNSLCYPNTLMRIHVCFLCGEKGLFLNQERVRVIEDCFCFRKKVCFFLFCSYVFNRLLTWPTDQPRYASYKSYIMSNPWHPQIYLVHEQDRTEHPHVLAHSQRVLPVTFFSLASSYQV